MIRDVIMRDTGLDVFMKTLKIGIMPREDFQKRFLEIARGRYSPKRDEPKVWFSSIKSLSQVLSENNIRLLKIIEQQQPETLTELSEMSGRKLSNLSRTLKTLERYGIISLVKTQTAVRPVAKATSFNILYAA